ncbi:piercer of microtubule wall 1 protein isoform X2 [Helicoverpa armigera]|uniref:piercer of microtubule wall 1 protein isoform X2 n=1 Tax=Helicoverpa armigera TaxID=29058 RepID=UPI003083C263
MSEQQPQDEAFIPNAKPGFCSATCTDKESTLREMRKEDVKTSDLYTTCNLPKRFEHPHWFNGYGCQVSKQHPFYRTTANDYGWYPPGWRTVTREYFPRAQSFSTSLAQGGMYRNYSLNTGFDKRIV